MHCVVSGAQDQGNVPDLRQPGTPYYLDVSVVPVPGRDKRRTAGDINDYMIHTFSINPATLIDFPDVIDVLGDNALRRLLGVHSGSYYSAWKVRETFDVRDLVSSLANGTRVKIVRIFVDGGILQHDNYVYESNGPQQPCTLYM